MVYQCVRSFDIPQNPKCQQNGAGGQRQHKENSDYTDSRKHGYDSQFLLLLNVATPAIVGPPAPVCGLLAWINLSNADMVHNFTIWPARIVLNNSHHFP